MRAAVYEREVGDERVVSIVALGGAMGHLPFVSTASVRAALAEFAAKGGPRLVAMNLQALDLGLERGVLEPSAPVSAWPGRRLEPLALP